jgi:hypothetical protein
MEAQLEMWVFQILNYCSDSLSMANLLKRNLLRRFQRGVHLYTNYFINEENYGRRNKIK